MNGAFDLKCDADGYVFAIDPETGETIEGTCTELVTEKTEKGIKVTQVTIVPAKARACVWRKVGGRWVCL